MLRTLLLVGLLVQGIPTRPDQTGVVTGTLRTADGKPAISVRVAARAVGDSAAEAQQGAALSGLAETDASGRFRLEGVPAGRYVITAGRVDLPTYYPGTLDLASGKILTIIAGSVTSGIDFTLADMSYAMAGASSQPPGVVIGIKVAVEGTGRIPVFANGNFVRVALYEGNVAQASSSLTASSVVLSFPASPRKFEARVENLPPGFAVKSLTYGSTNLMTDPLSLSPADFPMRVSSQAMSGTNILALLGGPVLGTSARSPDEIKLTLAYTAPPPSVTTGVRISGRLPAGGVRSIFLSGVPGTLYSDGTFEFLRVPPGRHVAISGDGQLSLFGAVVVVGDRDLDGVQLDRVLLIPLEAPAVQADPHSPGAVVPLGGLRGRIVSAATGEPMRGVVTIIGDSAQAPYVVGNDGSFEIPKLLPGSYNLQVSIFDHYTLNQTVVVGETDTTVELRVRRAY